MPSQISEILFFVIFSSISELSSTSLGADPSLFLSLGTHAQIDSRGKTNPSRVTCNNHNNHNNNHNNHSLEEILTMTRRRSDSTGTESSDDGWQIIIGHEGRLTR